MKKLTNLLFLSFTILIYSGCSYKDKPLNQMHHNFLDNTDQTIDIESNTLSPVIGFLRQYKPDHFKGVTGLYKQYDEELKQGNLKLNISLNLQKNIEKIADKYKKELNAQEILISVMESTTGKMLTLASSNRFNPKYIKSEEIKYLNINSIDYLFEPASILKPITISLALDNNIVSVDEKFFMHNDGFKNEKGEYPKGKYKIDRWTITENKPYNKQYLDLNGIIKNSSNIGTLLVANKLDKKTFYEGLFNFGFGKKSNIDLPYERSGILMNKKQGKIYKVTHALGMGILTNHIQLLKAYNVFNNEGKIIIPTIVKNNDNKKQILKVQTVNMIKDQLLIKQNDKVSLYGTNSTMNSFIRGKYTKKYNNLFFGFVNDKNENKYTLGITILNSSNKETITTPIVEEIINVLFKENTY